jgi:flavin reductase ActVB
VTSQVEPTPALFQEAMSAFPSGVTLVTTTDRTGVRWGFAASSFCSLSLAPPLVLVCQAKTAQCYDAFQETDEWAIQVANSRHLNLISRFATKGADKFGGGEFVHDRRGVPVLPDASVVLECAAHDRLDGSDHTILVARLRSVTLRESVPVLYFRRGFHPLDEMAGAGGGGA